MSQPLISLCMIVKNEEDVLDRCLASVKELVDEIIIVDTGSTDETIAVAQKFNAVIIHYEWNNDFSSARNEAINHATGKWILILDADEVMESDIHAKLREGISDCEEGAFIFNINNYTDTSSTDSQIHTSVRLFLNTPQNRYRGRIHEQVTDSILEANPNTPLYTTPFFIYHYGYTKECVQKKDKTKRNLSLLQAVVEDDPNDIIRVFTLGVEYLCISDFENAYKYLNKSRLQWHSQVKDVDYLLAVVYKHEAFCLFQMGKTEESILLLMEATNLFPTYTDIFHNLGVVFMHEKRYKEARIVLEKALDLGVTTEFETNSGVGTYKTAFLLGKMEEEQGNYKDAVYFYEKSLKDCGESQTLEEALSRVKKQIQ